MERWLVTLEGKRFDLEEFSRSFPCGDLFIFEEEKTFYLGGKPLDSLPGTGEVQKMAEIILAEFTGILLTLQPNILPPRIGPIVGLDRDGRRKSFVLGTASCSGRSKGYAVLRSAPEKENPGKTQGQVGLELARSSTHLLTAVRLWAEPSKTWSLLYRIVEEIEGHLEKHVDVSSLFTGNERKRFARTANAAEVSGKEARHRRGKCKPPNQPMDKREAETFVRKLLEKCLSQNR